MTAVILSTAFGRSDAIRECRTIHYPPYATHLSPSKTALEDDSPFPEDFRRRTAVEHHSAALILDSLSFLPGAAAGPLLPQPSVRLWLDYLTSERAGLQSKRPIVRRVLARESLADPQEAVLSSSARKFFERAELQLSSGTEITSQYAHKLLRRIELLIASIRPDTLPGRLLAFIDSEDKSASIEWIRDRSRLGFVFDRENESSWFVVLPTGVSTSGYLYGMNGLKSLRGLLEEFLAAEQ